MKKEQLAYGNNILSQYSYTTSSYCVCVCSQQRNGSQGEHQKLYFWCINFYTLDGVYGWPRGSFIILIAGKSLLSAPFLLRQKDTQT